MPKKANRSIDLDGTPDQRPTFHPRRIPDELKRLKRWVVWRREPPDRAGGKPRKVPYSAEGRRASSTDPKSWTTFEAALRACVAGGYDGLMFALVPDDGYVFIDLDECRNANNKSLHKWAKEIVDRFNSHTELSVSGTGVHILIKGEKPGTACRRGKVECYSESRFMVVTGRIHKGRDTIHDRQDQLEAFYRDHLESPEHGSAARSPDRGEPIPEEKLQSLLEHAKAAAIYSGEYNGQYTSQSEADLALCRIAVDRYGFTEPESRTLLERARKNAGADGKHDPYYRITYQRVRGEVAPVELPEARRTFEKRLLYPNSRSYALDLVLAVVASSHLPGDPVWLHLVGPPSSGKTEHINAVDGSPSVYSVSELTAAGLVNGIDTDDGTDHSLLPHLHRRTLCIKDFTPILDMPKESRQRLLGRLRDAYDGSQTIHNSIVGTRTHRATFNCITGVTNAIDNFWCNISLGERFLIYRNPTGDPLIAGKAAFDGADDKSQMRKELRGAAQGVLARVNYDWIPTASEHIRERIVRLAAMLAQARTHVKRDRGHHVTNHPQPEGSTRITQQLKKLGQGLALINERDEIDDEDVAILARVALDSMPPVRLLLICWLARKKPGVWALTKGIEQQSELSKSAIREKLEDLCLLKIADKKGTHYRLRETFRAYSEGIEF